MVEDHRHASIVIAIGGESRRYDAFVTSAEARIDAPSTLTLCTSTLGDLALFAGSDLTFSVGSALAEARLILVDATELAWQRARCREVGHLLVPADPWLAGGKTLQPWLWRRLRGDAPGSDDANGE